MPLISTRGGLSSRGYGQFGRVAGPTLQTFTFPAGSSTFTVPATTNLLVSAVGAGADGTPGGTTTVNTNTNLYTLRKSNTNVPNASPDFYQNFYSSLAAVVNQFNQGGNIYYDRITFACGPDDKTNSTSIINLLASNVIAGSATGVAGGSGTPPTSGQVTYASLGGQFVDRIYTWAVFFQRLDSFPPTTGASTTGFGLTFPGGAGGPSTTTTFNNVAVVPNQTYTIQNNKSLTITYFA